MLLTHRVDENGDLYFDQNSYYREASEVVVKKRRSNRYFIYFQKESNLGIIHLS